MQGQIGTLKGTIRQYAKLESHGADSRWQFCNCASCQDYRFTIESSPPGTKFDFDKFRHKDEKY